MIAVGTFISMPKWSLTYDPIRYDYSMVDKSLLADKGTNRARPPFIDSDWYRGTAQVRTFRPEELIATKIRALYQRSKGRDLYDLWLALTVLKLDTDLVIEAFTPYRPNGFTSKLAINNLEAKLQTRGFQEDIRPLVADTADVYNLVVAGQTVIERLLSRL